MSSHLELVFDQMWALVEVDSGYGYKKQLTKLWREPVEVQHQPRREKYRAEKRKHKKLVNEFSLEDLENME